MPLYLVQHGKNLPQEQDPDKPLSEEGRSDVAAAAAAARKAGVRAAKIEHSGKARARQTAEILAEALSPRGGVAQRDGLSPNDDVEPVAKSLSPGDDLMLVGHLPFMEKLAARLVAGREEPVVKFQKGGIVCLDKEGGGWYVKWTLFAGTA